MRKPRDMYGAKHPMFKGVRHIRHRDGKPRGIYIYHPHHHERQSYCRITEQRLLCEKALGRLLPQGCTILHIDKDTINNGPGNLVLCGTRAYMIELLRRQRAYKGCGEPTWYQCNFCHEWCPEGQLSKSGTSRFHNPCRASYRRQRRAEGLDR